MEYVFSNKVSTLKPSAIREIFKYSADPTYIPLSAGNPSPEAFPVDAIREISLSILEKNPIGVLQYGITEGYKPLIEILRQYMLSEYNIGGEREGLIITSGAQQAIDLAVKALCNEGDIIICESPSFIGSINCFKSHGCKVLGAPTQKDGIDLEALEKLLKENDNVKIIYTIPNFQNPTGISMSNEKRQKLYSLAVKYNVIILEDNPYGELYYSDNDALQIKSLDKDGCVIYVGSFSKVISPGMRVGWAVAPQEIIQKMVVCKQGQDVHTNVWAQMIAYEFMSKYDFSKHLENLREIYGKKAQFTRSLIDKHFGDKIECNEINGGLFVWCTLPKEIDMCDFCQRLLERKVCVVPGNAFLPDDNMPCNSFRINFSTPTNEQLEKGIKAIGELINEMI